MIQRDQSVFALISVVGILTMLLVVTSSVVYLVLPRGRMCPRCGGCTSPIVLRRMLRVLSPWVQWRWCFRCEWEGPGRTGPELGILDPSVGHESGFRWGHPNLQGVPVFYWRDETETAETSGTPSAYPSGFDWASDEREGADRRVVERRQARRADHASGFHFRASEEVAPPSFQWAPSKRSADEDAEEQSRPPSQRPWYLAWLVSKEPPSFHWKAPGD